MVEDEEIKNIAISPTVVARSFITTRLNRKFAARIYSSRAFYSIIEGIIHIILCIFPTSWPLSVSLCVLNTDEVSKPVGLANQATPQISTFLGVITFVKLSSF